MLTTIKRWALRQNRRALQQQLSEMHQVIDIARDAIPVIEAEMRMVDEKEAGLPPAPAGRTFMELILFGGAGATAKHQWVLGAGIVVLLLIAGAIGAAS